MRFSDLKQDKGVAGLTILLSIVVMLFVIGLIVMIFSLMGAELQVATYTSTTARIDNETVVSSQTAGLSANLSHEIERNVDCTIFNITNGTGVNDAFEDIVIANFTETNCVLVNASSMVEWDTSLAFSYTYTFDANNTATDVMYDTTIANATVVDWFSIFIVIGAMVVLILLTVIIITAIRGSGMIEGGTTGGGRGNVGSA